MVEVRVLGAGVPEQETARALGYRAERRDGHPALGDAVWRDLAAPAPASAGFAAYAGDEPVGYLRAVARPGTPLAFDLGMVVHPDHRDDGVPGALVETGIAHARAVGATHVDLWVFGADTDTDALATRHGLRVERELWQMRAPLPLAEQPVWPPGVSGRAYRGATDDEALLAVNNRAFADDPDQGGWTLETLRDRTREAWFDGEGLIVADDGGRIAGFCWTKEHAPAPPHEPHALGEIYVIGVDPADRGRGLGRALTVAGLAHLHRRGIEVGLLFVDASNVAAVGLYRALRFVTSRVDRAYGAGLAGRR